MQINVWQETFAIIKSKRMYPDAFTNINDKKEKTVIIDQTKYNEKDVIEIEKDWKLITFDIKLPFTTVGFLAKISKALADENVPIMAISAYSTDHIFIKEKDLKKALKKLKSLGCVFAK